MTKVIALHALREIEQFFRTRTVAKSLAAIAFIFLLSAVGYGVYLYTRLGLSYINDTPDQGNVLLFLYEAFYGVLFYIISFGGALTYFYTVFKKPSNNWIVASPHFKTLIVYYFVRILLVSLLPILVFSIPTLLAAHTIFDVSFGEIGILLIENILLMVAAIGSSIVILLFSAIILNTLRIKNRNPLSPTSLLIFVCVIYLGFLIGAWFTAIPDNFIEFWGINTIGGEPFPLELVQQRFSWLPTHITAQMLFTLQHESVGMVFDLIAYRVFGISAVLVLVFLTNRAFLPIWLKLQEGSFIAQPRSQKSNREPHVFPMILKSQIGLLIEKEILVAVRNTREVIWLVFLTSIWVLYIGFNFIFLQNIGESDIPTPNVEYALYSIQILIGIYFITALTLRFVFPSFSREQRTSWVLLSAPVNLKKQFYGKLYAFLAVFCLLAFILSGINLSAFRISQLDTIIFIIIILTSASTVVTFGLSMGIIFPQFNSDNPEDLSTSIPGMFFTFLSIIIGGVGAFVFYLYLQSGETTGLILFELMMLVFSIGLARITPDFLRIFENRQALAVA